MFVQRIRASGISKGFTCKLGWRPMRNAGVLVSNAGAQKAKQISSANYLIIPF